MEGMNQFRTQYIYTWKHCIYYTYGTFCIDILNKQNCLFFKNGEQKVKTVPIWRYHWEREDIRKEFRSVNVVEILRIRI
jgi:hypothetical protein